MVPVNLTSSQKRWCAGKEKHGTNRDRHNTPYQNFNILFKIAYLLKEESSNGLFISYKNTLAIIFTLLPLKSVCWKDQWQFTGP